MTELTQKCVKALFKYDGCDLWWKYPGPNGRRPVDRPAGYKDKDYGYLIINVKYRLYKAHRLVWLYVHGRWPKEIDHINGDRADNRIENLREVTRSQNRRNSKKPSTNTSGHMGVYLNKKKGKPFRAGIWHNNRQIWIGSYNSIEEAVAARKAAERKYGYSPNHGRD